MKTFDGQVVPISPTRPNRTPASRQAGHPAEGIDVREERLGSVTAQPMFRLCCECGRSWYELELPTFVRCPECAKLGVVYL